MRLSGAWKVRLLCFFGLIVAALLALGWWYFAVYTKSPDYSVRMIRDAIASHDTEQAKRFVDFDRLLDSSADGLLEALIENEKPLSEEAKLAIGGFTKIFREPLVESFRELLLRYVEKGEWNENGPKDKVRIDAGAILERAGLKELSFRQLDYVNIDESGAAAEVGVRLLIGEIGEEYVLRTGFYKTDEGFWRAESLLNLHDLIMFVRDMRLEQMKDYLAQTGELLARHEATIKLAELQQNEIIASGSLAKDETRQRLKKLVEEVVIPDWQLRQTELQKLEVPSSARQLHRLRLKVCELRLQHAALYVKWLEDKKGKTVREANDKLKEAGALEREAVLLTGHAKKDK